MKRFIGPIIFLLIEMFSYFKFKPSNLEAFFMIWAIISFVLLIYNLFNIDSNTGITLVGSPRDIVTNLEVERKYGSDNRKHKTKIRPHVLSNLVYIVFLVGNIVAYIIVMPN